MAIEGAQALDAGVVKGKPFRYANYHDWGGGDFLDMMAGVDKLIEMSIADPERLGIAGCFKAASIGAPMTES